MTCVVLMEGCQTAPVAPAIEIPTEPEPVPAAPPAVDELLDQAELALRNDQLTHPETGSALVLFNEVLALDESNAVAKRGLERIVERYLELAERAAQRRQFARSRSMLTRARLVDPEHPAIEPTASQVQLLANARRRGLAVAAWTVNDSTEMKTLILAGIDGIVSDRIADLKTARDGYARRRTGH